MSLGPALAAGLLVSAQNHDDGVSLLRGLYCSGDELAIDRRGDEFDLVTRPAATLSQPDGFAIVDGELAATGLLDPVEDADDMARDIAVASNGRVLGMSAKDRNSLDPRWIERE